MNSPLLLGLDLGTTNAKAAAYDLEGQCIAETSASYPTYFPQPGWAEQRPEDWLTALTQAIRSLTVKLGDGRSRITGIGLSAHGPSMLLIDAQGRPVRDACPTWQDERAADQGQRLLDRLGSLWPGMGSPLQNFPPRLLWIIENYPDLARRARYALSIKDYIAFWLTGQIATEPSSGPGAEAWPTDIFDLIGWSMDRLPAVLSPIAQVGTLRSDLAESLNLPRDLPVVIGLNDGASASLATGATRSGDAVITLSTNGVARVILKSALPPATRIDHFQFNWPYLPGLWIAGGQTKAGASSLTWLASIIGLGDQALEKLIMEAGDSPPGSRGVTFLPYLMGRGSPHNDPMASAAFTGLTFTHTRGDMVRAVLEGTVFALKEILDDFAGMGFPAQAMRLSGGGARSSLWRKILTNVTGQTLTYYTNDSTLGAAILTAVGLGLYLDPATAAVHMTRPEAETQPDPQRTARYASLYAAFREIRDRMFP